MTSAHRFRADDVGICVSTLHVDPHGFVPADVERFTRIAAEAGFPSLAYQIHWVLGLGPTSTRALLDDLGITAGALEGSMRWVDGPDAAAADAAQLLDVAAEIGATTLHAACMATAIVDRARAVDGFAALCERSEPYGIRLGLEFIPYYGVPDLAAAWGIVRDAGGPNGGVCIDLMHWHRQPGGPDYDELRAIPAEHITYVQLTDAGPGASEGPEAYMAECLSSRPVPGDGVVDVAGMLDALQSTGADPLVVYQVCNPALAATGGEAMAAALRANAAAILAE
jgi:sugar phosphate isomerase/epimerase